MTALTVVTRRFALREAFVISRGARTHVETVEVTLTANGQTGRGECVPYKRYGETAEGVMAAIEGQATALAGGLDREGLQAVLPAGAARNALDLAFWDLEAKCAGLRVWDLPAYAALGGTVPGPVASAYTLSIGTPEAMREAATKHAHRPILKVKLAGEDLDIERMQAVRAGAPEARLVVDANEGWSAEGYGAAADAMAAVGVEFIEQPIHADHDAALTDLPRPVPLVADEACHDRATLNDLAGKYDVVNIKLDKAGGLTEALALKVAARAQGFGIMIGCMMSSSLGVAPAVLLGDGAALVDLDPPMLLGEDRDPPLGMEGASVLPPDRELWG
ncbi:MAG: N-acetyl-D-Glu racemase DgcA [Pseudomonadota bacterium]